MATRYWLVPIRSGASYLGPWTQIERTRKKGGDRRLIGERIPAMAPSNDDDGDSPAIDDSVEYEDDVQKRMANSRWRRGVRLRPAKEREVG
jgi:hypothetical protein